MFGQLDPGILGRPAATLEGRRLPVFSSVRLTLEQIRATLCGSGPPLLPAPGLDALVVAREQYVGNRPAAEGRRTGVVRLLEKTGAEALERDRLRVAHDAGEQSGHSFDDRKGTDFTTEQHVVTQRNLVVDQVIGNPLVHAFVAATNECEMLAAGPLVEEILGHRSAGSSQEDPAARRQRLQCLGQRFDHHDHARPATKWSIVELPVEPFPEIPQVDDFDPEQSILDGARNETDPQWGVEELREHGDHGDLHAYRVF